MNNRFAHKKSDVEWYTPPEVVEAARRVMGGIDLDPCSNPIANSVVQAKRFFTADDDCRRIDWGECGRVFMNPPFSSGLMLEIIDKLLTSNYEQAIVLTNNVMDTRAGALLAAAADAICFPPRRMKFWQPSKTEPFHGFEAGGELVRQHTQVGQMIVGISVNVGDFVREFKGMGQCFAPLPIKGLPGGVE